MYLDLTNVVLAHYGWRRVADPEITGSSVWVHDDYDGKPNFAVLATGRTFGGGYTSFTVLSDPTILPGEVDGECLGTFPTWYDAWDFALGLTDEEVEW